MNKVFEIIKQVAKNHNSQFNLDEGHINSTLKSLGIDSLEAMGIIIDVEKQLNVILSDEALMNMKTLNDLIQAFEKLVK
jgi:acyl carrier protein